MERIMTYSSAYKSNSWWYRLVNIPGHNLTIRRTTRYLDNCIGAAFSPKPSGK
jgi:hypothetical protein